MKFWKVGLAGALVAVPVVALASGPFGGDGPGWGRHHGGGHHMGLSGGMIEMLQGMDTDRDGVISAAEFGTGHGSRMMEADADGDGSVTLEEMQARAIERMQVRLAERFAGMDADGDGAVTAEELAKGWEERFARMDRDGDGNLTIHDLSGGGGGRGGDGGPGRPGGPDGPLGQPGDDAPAE